MSLSITITYITVWLGHQLTPATDILMVRLHDCIPFMVCLPTTCESREAVISQGTRIDKPQLHDTIQKDLKLTKIDIANSNIVALCATLLVRLVAGPCCDRFGPRWTCEHETEPPVSPVQSFGDFNAKNCADMCLPPQCNDRAASCADVARRRYPPAPPRRSNGSPRHGPRRDRSGRDGRWWCRGPRTSGTALRS